MSVRTIEGHIQHVLVDMLMTYLRTNFYLSRSSGSILTITERKAEENLSQLTYLLFYILRKENDLNKVAYYCTTFHKALF